VDDDDDSSTSSRGSRPTRLEPQIHVCFHFYIYIFYSTNIYLQNRLHNDATMDSGVSGVDNNNDSFGRSTSSRGLRPTRLEPQIYVCFHFYVYIFYSANIYLQNRLHNDVTIDSGVSGVDNDDDSFGRSTSSRGSRPTCLEPQIHVCFHFCIYIFYSTNIYLRNRLHNNAMMGSGVSGVDNNNNSFGKSTSSRGSRPTRLEPQIHVCFHLYIYIFYSTNIYLQNRLHNDVAMDSGLSGVDNDDDGLGRNTSSWGSRSTCLEPQIHDKIRKYISNITYNAGGLETYM
jgi:hypothetical protein